VSIETAADGTILLKGDCPSEDAELLLKQLLVSPGASVDLRACETAHTAVIQVLMAAKARIIGPAAGATFNQWVYSHLAELHNS
jgi:hypothetical protein